MAQQQRVKKIPQRKCIGCGEQRPKSELIRILRLPDGGTVIDATGKRSGRGAYLCHDPACLKKARKARRAESALDCEISAQVWEALEAEMEQICR